MIRLNDLYNFISVSGFESLSLAAKKLGLTQPALSESIGRLEKDLGFKLFYRTKNGISLTPEGRKTLEKAKEIENGIKLLSSKEEQNENFPTLILGSHITVASYFLPQFLTALAKEIPNYNIQVKHDLSRNIQMEIQSGKVDFAVIVNPFPNPDLIIRALTQDRVCVWKSSKVKPQQQIIADPNLFQTQSILKKWKKAPTDFLAITGLELIARMTEQGCGYGVLPERIVKLMGLKLVPVPNTPHVIDKFGLVYRPEFGKTYYEKTVVNLILETFR